MSFGSYSLWSLGKGLFTFNDVPEAYEELMKVRDICYYVFPISHLTCAFMPYRRFRKQKMTYEQKASPWIRSFMPS